MYNPHPHYVPVIYEGCTLCNSDPHFELEHPLGRGRRRLLTDSCETLSRQIFSSFLRLNSREGASKFETSPGIIQIILFCFPSPSTSRTGPLHNLFVSFCCSCMKFDKTNFKTSLPGNCLILESSIGDDMNFIYLYLFNMRTFLLWIH